MLMNIEIGQKAIVTKNDGQHNFPVGAEITFIGMSDRSHDDWFTFTGVNTYGNDDKQILIEEEFELKEMV
jgi:hypothetical protein